MRPQSRQIFVLQAVAAAPRQRHALVGLRAIRNHAPHHGVVRKRQDALQMAVNNREMPGTTWNVTGNLKLCACPLTGQGSHIHRIPASNAAAVQRVLMRSG